MKISTFASLFFLAKIDSLSEIEKKIWLIVGNETDGSEIDIAHMNG